MSSIANLLAKVEQLHRQAVAVQPIDPLADLTDDQRLYYQQFWQRFRERNSKEPSNYYEAALNCTKWTPREWLSYPRITTEMSIEQAADIWRDQL
jgi:hypothetical protein